MSLTFHTVSYGFRDGPARLGRTTEHEQSDPEHGKTCSPAPWRKPATSPAPRTRHPEGLLPAPTPAPAGPRSGTLAAPERAYGPSCALPQHAPSGAGLAGLRGAGREAGSRADPQPLQGAGAPHAAVAAYDSSTCCQKTMADTVMTMITAGVKRSQMMGRASRRSENFRT